MQVAAFVLSAFVAFAFVSFAVAEYKESDDVKIATESNFDDIIKNNQFVLVEFYAPWCGHCKHLEPEYKKAATALKDEGVVLAAVDATAHTSLGSRFSVQGYPTLKFFIGGNPIEYTGGRTADTITSWLRKRMGPAAKKIDASEVATFADATNVAVVGFFGSETDAGFKAYETVAAGLDEVPFAVCFDAEAAKANGLESGSGVVLFKKFDERKNVLDGADNSADEIKSFVESNRLPSIIPFTMEMAGKIFQHPSGKIAMLFTNSPFPEFQSIAEKYKGKFVFSTATDAYDRLNSYIGVTPKDFPKFFILTTGGQLLKYPLETSDLTADAITAHIDGFLAGTVKPIFKSEEIPEDNDGPVTVIVGKNFNDIVLDETKDVFIELYAPWCGHCKSLAPIWDQLGEAFQDNKNIVIAKMDATANEVEDLNIRSFPTLQFYPAGSKTMKSAQPYSGGRDLASLKKFVEENAKGAAATGDHSKDEL